VVSLEHAIHETILRLGLVAFGAHESASVVITTSASAFEVVTTNAVHKTSTDFTHAVGGYAGNVLEGKTVYLLNHKLSDFVNLLLSWHVSLNKFLNYGSTVLNCFSDHLFYVFLFLFVVCACIFEMTINLVDLFVCDLAKFIAMRF
jgi:hypothetical protein